jgi:hypothetical protein
VNFQLNDGLLLKYEEAFNTKKATFEKTKVISFTLLFVFLSNFARFVCFSFNDSRFML